MSFPLQYRGAGWGGAHQTQPPVKGGCPWCRGRGAAASSDEPNHPCRSSFSSTRDDIAACDRQGPFSDMGRMTSSHIIPLWRLKRHEPIVWPCRGAISDVTGPDGEPHEMMARERLGNVAQREESSRRRPMGSGYVVGGFCGIYRCRLSPSLGHSHPHHHTHTTTLQLQHHNQNKYHPPTQPTQPNPTHPQPTPQNHSKWAPSSLAYVPPPPPKPPAPPTNTLPPDPIRLPRHRPHHHGHRQRHRLRHHGHRQRRHFRHQRHRRLPDVQHVRRTPRARKGPHHGPSRVWPQEARTHDGGHLRPR